jgi:uncharacterized protein with GYD domain
MNDDPPRLRRIFDKHLYIDPAVRALEANDVHLSLTSAQRRNVVQTLHEAGLLASPWDGEDGTSTLRHVTFECGHSRNLYFFADEPPLVSAMCLSGSCRPYDVRRIVRVEKVESEQREPVEWRVTDEVEAMGLKVVAQYGLMGQYDFLNVIESPDEATIAHAAITLAARGTMRTTTFQAISIPDLIAELKRASD